MKQYVHDQSYLVVNTLNLNGASEFRDLVALPNGANVVSAHVQIEEEADASITANVGIKGSDDYFMKAISLSAKKGFQSENQLLVNGDNAIHIKITGKPTKGKITLRVLYFLPSKILAEF